MHHGRVASSRGRVSEGGGAGGGVVGLGRCYFTNKSLLTLPARTAERATMMRMLNIALLGGCTDNFYEWL